MTFTRKPVIEYPEDEIEVEFQEFVELREPEGYMEPEDAANIEYLQLYIQEYEEAGNL